MKGIVFTEFLEMVEQKFGYEMVDQLIEGNELPSQGAYTAIGTYEYSEMVTLLVDLHKKTKIPIPKLLHTYGLYLFQTFVKVYPHFFEKAPSAFEFLESIENYIHVEVRKLYPDAELPTFETNRIDGNSLEMIYYSERKMGDFAQGLIEATMQHYQEKATVEQFALKKGGAKVHFLITKHT